MALQLGTAKEANCSWTTSVMAAAAPRKELPACRTSFNDSAMTETEYRPPRGGDDSGARATFLGRPVQRVALAAACAHVGPVRVPHEAGGFLGPAARRA